MGVTNRLIYDPTDADSIAASSKVGSYVLSGDDGSPIGYETLNAVDWLRTSGPIIDSSGNEVAVTSNALDVNIASGSISFAYDYDEDTAHTTGDSGVFTLSVRVDDLTAVPASVLADTEGDYQAFITDANGAMYVAGNQFDIDDLNATDDAVQAWAHDGTGTAITSTGGALDVNILSGDVDDDLAATAIANTATAVSTTAVNIVTSALADRKWLYLANEGNKSLYFGETGVTTANGFPLHPGMQLETRIGAAVTPQIIGGSGASSEDLRVMELS